MLYILNSKSHSNAMAIKCCIDLLKELCESEKGFAGKPKLLTKRNDAC